MRTSAQRLACKASKTTNATEVLTAAIRMPGNAIEASCGIGMRPCTDVTMPMTPLSEMTMVVKTAADSNIQVDGAFADPSRLLRATGGPKLITTGQAAVIAAPTRVILKAA